MFWYRYWINYWCIIIQYNVIIGEQMKEHLIVIFVASWHFIPVLDYMLYEKATVLSVIWAIGAIAMMLLMVYLLFWYMPKKLDLKP